MSTNKNTLFDGIDKGDAWDTGVTFKRVNPVPIDKYSVFKTKADAVTYASSNPVAYPGQMVAVIPDSGDVICYTIQTNGTLKEIANGGSVPTKVSQLENDSKYITQGTFDENMQAIDGQITELMADLESTDLTVTDNYNRLDEHETEINGLSQSFSGLTKIVNERFISRDVIHIATGAEQTTSNSAVRIEGGYLKIDLAKILYQTEWTILLEPSSLAGLTLMTSASNSSVAYNIPYAHIRIITPKKAFESVSSEYRIPIKVNMVVAGQTEINILIVSNQIYAY